MVDIELSKTWHKVFALHLEFVVDGIEPLDMDISAVRDDGRCRLGQWIGDEGARFGSMSEFALLRQRHREFHEVAGAMLEAHLAADHDLARRLEASRFHDASTEVFRALDAFGAALRASGRDERSSFVKPAAAVVNSVWDESLRIGVHVIDEQHRAIATLIDRLLADSTAPADSERVTDALDELGRIIAVHFETEELLLKRAGVAGDAYNQHVREHNRILEDLVQLHLDIASGQLRTIADVQPMLLRWVIDHVLVEDRQLIGRISTSR